MHIIVVLAKDTFLNTSFNLACSYKYVAAQLTVVVSAITFGGTQMAGRSKNCDFISSRMLSAKSFRVKVFQSDALSFRTKRLYSTKIGGLCL